LGAPSGHPFYGNQYTDGGYVIGSFTYEVAEKSIELVEKSVEAVKTVVSEVTSRLPNKAMAVATDKQVPSNIILSTVNKISKKGLNKNHFIAAGVGFLIVAVSGGILYYNKKSKRKKDDMNSADFSVGICSKCAEPLIGSTYVPGHDANNNKDSCIVCKNCGAKNFAWYPDDNK